MKILILAFSTLATLFGAWLWNTSQNQGLIPALRTVKDTVLGTGITALPGQALEMSRELVEIAQANNLGIWHAVLIAFAVLLARKVVMWIVH